MPSLSHAIQNSEELGALAERLLRAVDSSQGFIDIGTCVDIANSLAQLEWNAPQEGNRVQSVTPGLERHTDDISTAHEIRMALDLHSHCSADLLFELVKRGGKPVSADLLQNILGITNSSLKVYICHLRSELRMKKYPIDIVTVRKVGYFLRQKDAEWVFAELLKRIDNQPIAYPTAQPVGNSPLKIDIGDKKAGIILNKLLQTPDRICTYAEFRDKLGLTRKTVSVYACILRRKLNDIGIYDALSNVSGTGYYINIENSKKIIARLSEI